MEFNISKEYFAKANDKQREAAHKFVTEATIKYKIVDYKINYVFDEYLSVKIDGPTHFVAVLIGPSGALRNPVNFRPIMLVQDAFVLVK